MDKQYHLVINKTAGGGNGKHISNKVIKQFQLQNISFQTYYTNYAGHEQEIIKMLAEKILKPWHPKVTSQAFPIVVILGGDGTLHRALNELQHYSRDIPIGYIPCGSGNDFARGAGIAKKTEKAIAQLLRATQPKRLPVIEYKEAIQDETGLAVNNVGIGLDAAIVSKANRSSSKKQLNKFKLGSFSYLFSVIKVLFTQPSFPILIELNGQTIEYKRAFLCTVTNHPYFGGGIAIAPNAEIAQEKMDLIIVERINLFKILWLILLLLQKKHLKSNYLHHYHSPKIRIVSTVPKDVHADGETLGDRAVDFTFKTQNCFFWFTEK